MDKPRWYVVLNNKWKFHHKITDCSIHMNYDEELYDIKLFFNSIRTNIKLSSIRTR